MTTRTEHAFAFALASFLVFGIGIQDLAIVPASRLPGRFTPYYPGLRHLDEHEVFAPKFRRSKKIVLLGASTEESIGCDASWSIRDPSRDPMQNVHWSCTVAHQLEGLLAEHGRSDWQVFDLACNGAKLTAMLYVYARLADLEPDIVIYGTSGMHFLLNNAGASEIKRRHYDFMDETFDRSPDTRDAWNDLRATLDRHGWTPGNASANPTSDPPNRVGALEVANWALAKVQALRVLDAPPHEVRLYPWTLVASREVPFLEPEDWTAYLRGIEIIGDLQRAHGGSTLFYYAPNWRRVSWTHYRADADAATGPWMQAHGIAYANLEGEPFAPRIETYDGAHNTLDGNRRVAGLLLRVLEEEGLLEGSRSR